MNVLFVCTGNTCRSAMAQGIAKALIKKEPERYRQIKVASAGTYTTEGEAASELAREVASEHGVDLASFGSQQVTPQLLENADLVLAMTGSHKKLLNTLAPQAVDKIYLLKEYEYGDDVNALNMRLAKLFEDYGAVRENFVKGNQEKLKQLDKMNETNPQAAEKLFQQLNGELAAGVKEMDEEINAIHEKLKSMEVPDPFGGNKAEYEICYDELAKSIKIIFDKLIDDGIADQYEERGDK